MRVSNMRNGNKLPAEIEHLFEIAKTNPAGFQQAASALITKEIKALAKGDAELEQRMRASQWALETRLSKYKDPVARRNAMWYILHKQVLKQQAALDGLAQRARKLKQDIDAP